MMCINVWLFLSNLLTNRWVAWQIDKENLHLGSFWPVWSEARFLTILPELANFEMKFLHDDMCWEKSRWSQQVHKAWVNDFPVLSRKIHLSSFWNGSIWDCQWAILGPCWEG
jgi:hypothetical protein